MSKELERYLAAGAEIPWDSAAAFFIATKEATMVKVAAEPVSAQQLVAEARRAGIMSGLRSSAASDITHATRTHRTRGERVGKEVGTLGGAAAGALLGRKGGVAGKIGGTAIGALLGRGVGKTVGQEVDRARTMKRYEPPKQKKAEIEKKSAVSQVRQLWKMAQGQPLDNVVGAAGTAGVPWDETMVQDQSAQEPMLVPSGPNIIPPSGAPTPEELELENAMSQVQEDLALDAAAKQNETEYYRQVAEEAQGQLQQMEQALTEAQQSAQMAQEQASMSQQQADSATMQLQEQAQQGAAEKQQLSDEAIGAKDTIMQMRQAMQSYRENLQQLALQDPTAMAGPSPEEQGMEPTPGQIQGLMAEKQMQKEEEEQAKAEEQAAAEEEQAAAEEEAAAAEEEAAAQEQAAAEEQAAMGKVSTVRALWKEKRAADWTTRALGAAIGAAGGAGIQALSDRRGTGGMSEKERVLKAKLDHLQAKKDPSVFDKHMMTMTRALADTAKINREHPGSAAAMAAITGAIAGAALAPTVSRMAGGLIGR